MDDGYPLLAEKNLGRRVQGDPRFMRRMNGWLNVGWWR
jgi:hypothetical protein